MAHELGRAKTSTKQLKKYLDENFKPIFKEQGDPESQGIPLQVIRQKLDDAEVTENIPADRRSLLLRTYDGNQDGFMNYDEFVQMVVSERPRLNLSKLTKFQTFIVAVTSTVIPENTQVNTIESYVDAYNCKPPPLFIPIISVIEVAVFIYYAYELADTANPVTATSGAPVSSPLIFNPKRRYEAWRYLTYMAIHVGYTHIIFNLIWQLLLGLPLETVHKWWRVALVYLMGVIAGSLASSVTDPNTFLAGASGGCYSLVGAHVAAVIMNWEEMQHRWMDGAGFKAFVRILLSAPVRLVLIFVIAAADVGVAVYKRYSGEETSVSYSAHLGGAVAGVLVGSVALKNLDKKPWEMIVWWVFLVVYLALIAFGVFWNGFYEGYPATDWTSL